MVVASHNYRRCVKRRLRAGIQDLGGDVVMEAQGGTADFGNSTDWCRGSVLPRGVGLIANEAERRFLERKLERGEKMPESI